MAKVLALTLLLLASCTPREGRNSDCQWPPGLPPASLRSDLEVAEELAIRYMDAVAGPRNPSAAAQTKNRCMTALLNALAPRHGLTAQQAYQSFGRRSLAIDLAIYAPFALLFTLAAYFFQRRFRSPVVAVALAVLAILLAQFWASTVESFRIGTSHLSNRTLRLPASQHPLAVFAIGLALATAARMKRSSTQPQ